MSANGPRTLTVRQDLDALRSTMRLAADKAPGKSTHEQLRMVAEVVADLFLIVEKLADRTEPAALVEALVEQAKVSPMPFFGRS